MPLTSPLFTYVHSLPSMLIQAGDGELLLDDPVHFAQHAMKAGVEADVLKLAWKDDLALPTRQRIQYERPSNRNKHHHRLTSIHIRRKHYARETVYYSPRAY